jgi:hypothetical protein
MSVQWVKPLLPTTLDDIESLPMPVTDTFLAPVSEHHANLTLCIIVTIHLSIKLDIVWVFPGPLDLEKLKHARRPRPDST